MHESSNELTAVESRTVELLAALIVPSEMDSPGAAEAWVVEGVRRLVAGSSHRKAIYANGARAFALRARLKFRKPLDDLDPGERLLLLEEVDRWRREWFADVSVARRVVRKVDVAYWKWRGVFPAAEWLPLLVQDVMQTFYTSGAAWAWLGFVGPPMPAGYFNGVGTSSGSE